MVHVMECMMHGACHARNGVHDACNGVHGAWCM